MPRALIFDMDGLLVESESIHITAWDAFLRIKGIEPPPGFSASLVGTSIRDNTITAKRRLGLPGDVDDLTRERDAFYLDMLRHENLEPLPGVPALLDLAEKSGLPLAVCSSSPFDQIDTILPKVLQATGRDTNPRAFFDVIVSGSNVTHQKPAPDVYLLCAEKLNIPPETCLAFEDSVAGAEAASAAGMTVIVAPNHFTDSSHDWPTPYVFPTLENFLARGLLRIENGRMILKPPPA